MKNRICILVAFIILAQSIFLPLLSSEAAADTRVTITIAAGGVACGLFLLLRFTFRASMIQQNQDEMDALFNGGSGGWNIQFPSINIRHDEEHRMSHSVHSQEMVQMDLLKFRF